MQEVYISSATGVPSDPTTSVKQTEIVDNLNNILATNIATQDVIAATGVKQDELKAITATVAKQDDLIAVTATGAKQDEQAVILEEIKMLVTLPQDITPTGSPTFAGETLTGLTPSRLVFTDEGKGLVSGETDITEAQLEELSDGSETALHSHAGASAGNCSMTTGVYTGNGNDDREINIGIDLASKTHVYVIIKRNGATKAVHRTEYEQGDFCMFYDAASDSNDLIQGFTSTGFEIGTKDDVNNNGKTYRYIAFWVD